MEQVVEQWLSSGATEGQPIERFAKGAVKPRRSDRGYKAHRSFFLPTALYLFCPQELWLDKPKVKPLRCPPPKQGGCERNPPKRSEQPPTP
jgi:hypothetical protein